MAEGTEIFVRNDKGTEYVGTVSCEAAPLPPSLVFTDYTREPSVLDGTKDPKHVSIPKLDLMLNSTTKNRFKNMVKAVVKQQKAHDRRDAALLQFHKAFA